MVTPKFVSTSLGIWLLGNLLFVTVWDLVVVALGWENSTVSYRLYLELNSHPWLYFLVGVGVGHLLAPLMIHATNGGAR